MTDAMKCQTRSSLNHWLAVLAVANLFLVRLTAAMCPRGCHCDDDNLRTVCESDARLEYIPHTLNPSLKQLYLYDNQLRGIQSSLSVYRNLEELDISRNQLSSLGENNFVENKRIQKIVVTNNFITAIENNTFNGLSSLTALYLNQNKLEELNANAFRPLIALQTLDLSDNNIGFVSINGLLGLRSLQTLNLRSNQLKAIPTDSFRFVPILSILNLGSNPLINITNNAFENLNQLTELGLEDCSLQLIEDQALSGVDRLLILNLSHNNLNEIPSKALSEVTLLEELSIGGNQFVTLSDKVFYNLSNLRTLVINESHTLSSIEFGAFDGLQALERLEMSGNHQLSHISATVLTVLPNLRELVLRSNGFISLQLDFINTIERQIFLDVRDNPFHCNCSLEWLQSYFVRTNATIRQESSNRSDATSYSYLDMLVSVSRVECHSPPALSRKLLIDLERDEFGCFQLETKIPIIIAIMIGVLLVFGVFIILVIRCKYGLTGLVKSQWFSGDNTVANADRHLPNDLNYRKPEFVFIPNIDLNVEDSQRALEEGVRYPLKMTPITEL